MSTKKFERLQTLLQEQVEGFRVRQLNNKRKAFRYHFSVIICGFLTTALLGIHSFKSNAVVTDMAFVLSACVTALSAIDSFFDHRSLWIRYTATYSSLRALQSKLEYVAADEQSISDAKVDQLFEEFEHILSETNVFWQQLRKEQKPKQES